MIENITKMEDVRSFQKRFKNGCTFDLFVFIQ